ncbi:hypothetical protein PG997_008067 [Apiospora hydei]|uniref:Gfd2/YDR514C-like C-terminal domain-containing protein n=1 Tax=Apiospora hydei TaxID=1337664 RepID=A0ABR1W9R5_9PEZI
MTSLHIKCPPRQNPGEWPVSHNTLIRRTPFHKTAEGKRMVGNKIWDCGILQEYADDCAFVGFDVEGHYSDPTQLGLSYLPGLPATPIPPGVLHGGLWFLNDKICSELWSLNIKPREDFVPRHTPCPCRFSTRVASIRAKDVDGFLLDLLSSWKRQSGKKYLVMVGFSTPSDLTVLTQHWPSAALVFDGWLDTMDLARGARAPRDVHGTSRPSLSKMAYSLGIRRLHIGRTHNAGADALMAMALMIAAWDAFARGEEFLIPCPSQKTEECVQWRLAKRLKQTNPSKVQYDPSSSA